MKFSERQLSDCYQKNLVAARGFPAEVREVCALIGVQAVFRMLEGPHSPRVHEAITHLISPALRPALRRWYGEFGLDLDSDEIEFREQLSQLAGETL